VKKLSKSSTGSAVLEPRPDPREAQTGYLLCTTCVHRGYCVYRKGRARVFQCAEFEGERPEPARGS